MLLLDLLDFELLLDLELLLLFELLLELLPEPPPHPQPACTSFSTTSLIRAALRSFRMFFNVNISVVLKGEKINNEVLNSQVDIPVAFRAGHGKIVDMNK